MCARAQTAQQLCSTARARLFAKRMAKRTAVPARTATLQMRRLGPEARLAKVCVAYTCVVHVMRVCELSKHRPLL